MSKHEAQNFSPENLFEKRKHTVKDRNNVKSNESYLRI